MELRQNAAAKATWTERRGTKTPEKAGSVSKETQPSAAEIDTTAPISRSLPFKNTARPINVKPSKNRTHHHSVVALSSKPSAPSAPSARSAPSMAPKQPTTNPTTPAELTKSVRVGGRWVRRPSRPPRNKAGKATLSADDRASMYPEMPGLSK